MKREWLGRAAVRLYPTAVRNERGAELLGTLLDAGDASTIAFAGQLCSVITAGLVARLRESMTQTSAQLAISTVAWVALVTVAGSLVAAGAFAIRYRNVSFTGGILSAFVLPALILVLFMVRRTRLSGLVGLGWVVFHVVDYYQVAGVSRPISNLVFWYLLPITGFAALCLVPQRVASRGRWVWLVPAAVYAFFQVTLIGNQSGLGDLAFVVVALCFLAFMPAFALGTALAQSAWGVWILTAASYTGRWTTIAIELFACTAVAVATVGVGRLLVRDSAVNTPPG